MKGKEIQKPTRAREVEEIMDAAESGMVQTRAP